LSVKSLAEPSSLASLFFYFFAMEWGC